MAADEDWKQYREVVIQSLRRIEEGLNDAKHEQGAIKTEIALLRKASDGHDGLEGRMKALENHATRVNTLLTIVGTALAGAWAFLLKKLFE